MERNHPLPAVLSPGAMEFESLVRWLISRQTAELGEIEEESDEDYEKCETGEGQKPLPVAAGQAVNPGTEVDELPALFPPTEESLRWAGFNGRCNKNADTCYSFWNLATLAVRNPVS